MDREERFKLKSKLLNYIYKRFGDSSRYYSESEYDFLTKDIDYISRLQLRVHFGLLEITAICKEIEKYFGNRIVLKAVPWISSYSQYSTEPVTIIHLDLAIREFDDEFIGLLRLL